MLLTRYAQLNGDLIRNLPSDMKSELIIFEGVIPDAIMSSLYANDSFYKKERSEFLNYRDDVREKMYYARGRREELANNDPDYDSVSARINIETDECIDFVKEYPKFKPLIESIIYEDQDLNVVKVVPIDEYLTEN
ncbi:hypothetical protein [uncultured Methanobrevibacter sp.]|uniref:hypothetical protein n=1 Tax=uncultured Methanobrevibacter sp. TaxID=253161 RepID=UPI0025DC9F70|nr:hypothetical protein [uncultured Methanobrevibacter sp.]